MRRIIDLANRDVIKDTEKAPLSHFFRTLELERAAGSVAGIRKKRFFCQFSLMVKPVK